MRHLLLCGLIAGLLSNPAIAGEQIRPLKDFKSITARGAYSVVVEVGQQFSVKLSGSDKFLSEVTTELVGDELILNSKEKQTIKSGDNNLVIISVPELSRYKMEGVGGTTINKLRGDRFVLQYEGVGKLTANGKVNSLNIKAKGVGSIDTKDLIADNVEASLEGVGSVSVFAKEKLNAAVQGIGSLTYYGKPRSISKAVDGIGSVRAGD